MLQSVSQVSFKANPVLKEKTEETVTNQKLSENSALERTPEVDKVDISNKKEVDNTNKPEASVAKKIGVGAASFVIPGLGQLINGQVKKGLIMFLGNAAINAITFTVFPLMGLAGAALNVYAAVDAVKNA